MSNCFKLNFDKTITRLAGYDYGENVFNEQVKPYINYEEPIMIEFPDNIIKSASSFIEGFFKEIISKFGYGFIDNQVKITCKNESLINSIKDNLI